jgi:uncharacterized protein (DUF302 family)
MEQQTSYSFGRTLDRPFEQVLSDARKALGKEEFGILSEIDVRAKFAEKLNIEFRPYTILGACIPKLAHQALSSEIALGTLLPCNVVVWAEDDGRTTVMAMDPVPTMQMIANPALDEIAAEVRQRLERALAQL